MTLVGKPHSSNSSSDVLQKKYTPLLVASGCRRLDRGAVGRVAVGIGHLYRGVVGIQAVAGGVQVVVYVVAGGI
jgi:hypothetical protein